MIDLRPAADPVVSLIVVTAGNPDRLVRCLTCVASARGDVPTEVIVVLNAAAEGTGDALAREVDGLRTVVSEVPLGFAGGVNMGARMCRGRYIAVLHDDTEVEPGWLPALVEALESDPRAGLAGSLLTDLVTGELQSVGHVMWSDASVQPPWDDGAPPAPETVVGVRDVDFCSSASLLARAEAWWAIGGMDEEIHPAQYVDADLAMAMRDAGWAVIVEPRSRVRHARGGSSAWWRKELAARRNGAYFRRKWATDLARQAARPSAAGEVPRARAATAVRAAAVRAVPTPRTGVRPVDVPGPDEDVSARERRALLRDLAYKDAVVAEADRRVAAHTDEVAGLHARLGELGTELERVVRGHAHEVAGRQAAESELAAVRGQLDTTRRELDAARGRLDVLAERLATLDAILAGRVWRARTAVRRLLHRRGRPG